MELVDILKITIPIIIAILAGMAGCLKWIFMREEKAKANEKASQKEYWGTVNENLQQNFGELKQQFKDYESETDLAVERLTSKIDDVDSRLREFREEVAGQYIKRSDWLEHAVNLERKVDDLRSDFNKEIKELIRSVNSWSTNHGTERT